MDNINRTESENRDLIRRKRTYILSRIFVNLLLIVAGTVIIGIIFRKVQTRTSLSKQQNNNRLALSEVVSILSKNSENADALTGIYHEGNWRTLDDVDLILSGGLFSQMMNSGDDVRSEILSGISGPAGVSYLYVLNGDGTVFLSPERGMAGRNPATTSHMTQENLNRLLAFCSNGDGTFSPVRVVNQHGTFYLYSKPFVHDGVTYALVTGVPSWTLDTRVSSLTDFEAVLSRMAVINDGFLFAVSREDGLFLYYKNGDQFLTGQNAFTTGLTEKIMTDGYSGIQTIQGERYYCTSRRTDSGNIVVAAAKESTMLSHDIYVLVWSAIGFILVMALCLSFSVIVMNDFIRQGISTEKKIIFKNSKHPLYFDKSVYRKTFPLMLLGILAVFGISFYTQTLLEITEGVDKSKVILQEITGRYEESVESAEITGDYYDNRFLSAARLMSVYVEGNPGVLNEATDKYYTVLGDDGTRHFLTDNEGNPLRSVASSAVLKDLCRQNSIRSITVFDDSGRTIATSTGEWYFTLSGEKDDPFHPFMEVLEGRTSSYLQTRTDDSSHYIGVPLRYFTRKDEAGNTVYVSRYEYEKAAAELGLSGGVRAGDITRHSSLLMIELDSELANTLAKPMDADNVLTTEMLDGGAIVMFDDSKDHVCVYSPVKASVGRTADELGISPNAFTGGTYYGFNRINGVSYFQYYRFVDRYFMSTAIPQSTMYTSRLAISLITAAVCMVLITMLLLTVTLTTEDEAKMYEGLLKGYVDEDLNSPIFNIILPSGRRSSTTMARIRWDNSSVPWSERSPEMKLGTILNWLMMIPVLYFVFSALGINRISSDDSVIRYIMSNGWDRSLNVFAVSTCIMVMSMTVIAIGLFRIPVRLCTSLLGTRGETIGHLLLSIVKYGGTLGALFYCLYLLGIDSANLLASAGILSLIIGLGAQSLIKDIIAGIFIVFEGEFRVGDIVTINNFRGTVTDIGLRTTKISGGGNIKIFNNSEISGVLNMTKETSVATATITAKYDQDIEKVEEILGRELPALKEINRKIVDGPTYLGVTAMSDRNYTITVSARCSEQDVAEVNRFLSKSLLQIFYRNDIKEHF